MASIMNPFYRKFAEGKRKAFAKQVNLFDWAICNFNHDSADELLVGGEITFMSIRGIDLKVGPNFAGIKPQHYFVRWRNVKEIIKGSELDATTRN